MKNNCLVFEGSRDGQLSLWQIKDDDLEKKESTSDDDVLAVPDVSVKKPKSVKKFEPNEKIRALAVNTRTNEVKTHQT